MKRIFYVTYLIRGHDKIEHTCVELNEIESATWNAFYSKLVKLGLDVSTIIAWSLEEE